MARTKNAAHFSLPRPGYSIPRHSTPVKHAPHGMAAISGACAHRSTIMSQYPRLRSHRIARRPSLLATTAVVPAPANGSSTMQGTGSPPQPHEGSQPVVVVAAGDHGTLEPMCVFKRLRSPLLAIFRSLLPDPRPSAGCFSFTRTQGAPHTGQHPRSLVPAWIIGSTRAGGNVAKWAPAKGTVAMVQTDRRLRLATRPATAAEKDSFCLTLRPTGCCGSRS